MAKGQGKKTINVQEIVADNIVATKERNTLHFSFRLKLIALLGIISCVVYANTLKNDFAFDDFIVIKQNSIVPKGISAIPEIFSSPYLRGNFVAVNDHYKPLSLAMFAVEYQLFDGSPVIFHLINILLFAGCVMLLFLFLDALFEHQRTATAFIASLLFALHPVQTEVVANIKSRDLLLCFFFVFFALNLFIKYMASGKWRQLISGTFLFFLSLISKEISVTFLAVIPLIFFFYLNENKRRGAFIFFAAVSATVVFLFIRHAVFNAYHVANSSEYNFLDNQLSGAPSLESRLATAIMIMGYYIRLLFIPYPLICDYSFHTIPFVHFSSIWVLLSLTFYLFLVAYGMYRLFKFPRDPIAFAIYIFLIPLSICSNIFLLIGATMGERFLFFPMVGFCFVVATLLEKWLMPGFETVAGLLKNKKLAFIIIPVCLIYSVTSISRNSDWKDNETLYKADVKKAPQNCRLFYNLGTTLLIASEEEREPETKKQLMKDGVDNLKTSLAIYPHFDLAVSEIGNAYFQISAYDSCEKYAARAIVLNPKDTIALQDLAAVYFKTKRYAKSLEICRYAVSLDPNYARGYRNMGNCYLMTARYDSAIYVLKKAIEIDPSNPATYERLAIAFKYAGNIDSASKYDAQVHSQR